MRVARTAAVDISRRHMNRDTGTFGARAAFKVGCPHRPSAKQSKAKQMSIPESALCWSTLNIDYNAVHRIVTHPIHVAFTAITIAPRPDRDRRVRVV